MELIKKYAKAVLAFVVLVITNLVANLTDGTSPWPASTSEWVRLLLTVILGTLAVFGTPNKQDQGQVAESLEKLPDAEAKQAVNKAYPTWNIG